MPNRSERIKNPSRDGGSGIAEAAPIAPTAAAGVESIAVTGFTPGADLKLYSTNDQQHRRQ